MDVGETEVAALETEGELFVIETEQVKNRRVQIVDVGAIAHGIETEFVVSPMMVPALVPPPANHIVNASMW